MEPGFLELHPPDPRIMGLIMAALAVQFVLEGLSAAFPSLHH